MKGYEAMPIRFIKFVDHDILTELGFDMSKRSGRGCSLCPKDPECGRQQDCDLDPIHVWVPEHVAAILKMQPGMTP
jgi:hypothetical protein